MHVHMYVRTCNTLIPTQYYIGCRNADAHDSTKWGSGSFVGCMWEINLLRNSHSIDSEQSTMNRYVKYN